MGEDVLKILFGLGDGETLDGVGCFVGIFVVDSEILGGGSGDLVDGGVSRINSFAHELIAYDEFIILIN